MSVVSPLVACGAVVPFAISIATGERPSALALVGAVVAIGGAVLASVDERRAAVARAGARDRARARRGDRARTVRVLPRARQPRGRRALDPSGARVGSLSLLVVAASACARPAAPAALGRPARRGGRPRGRVGERALRLREQPRPAGARLGARLALSGDHRPARARASPRAAHTRPEAGVAVALAGVAVIAAA